MKKLIAVVLLPALLLTCALAEDTWYCAACDRTLNSRFCAGCGAARPQKGVCAACGYASEDGSAFRFCPRCGAAGDAAAPTAAPADGDPAEETPAPVQSSEPFDLFTLLAETENSFPHGAVRVLLTTIPAGETKAAPVRISGGEWSVRVILMLTDDSVSGTQEVRLTLSDPADRETWSQTLTHDFAGKPGTALLGEHALAGAFASGAGDYLMRVYIGGRLATAAIVTALP